MKKVIYITILFVFFNSCTIVRPKFKQNGLKEARKIAIFDIMRSKFIIKPIKYKVRNIKNDNYFIFQFDDLDDKIERVVPYPDDSIGAFTYSFPTRYYEKRKFFFYWHDAHKRLNSKMVKKLQYNNCIDSSYLKKGIAPRYRIHSKIKKSIWYFVCKKDISKFKKKKAVWILEKDYPKINCN